MFLFVLQTTRKEIIGVRRASHDTMLIHTHVSV
jgi:hypothetical protein